MSAGSGELTGPDFARGFPLTQLADGGMIAGHAHGTAVLLARAGDDVFAVGANCTHYGAPLVEGLLVGDRIHCPWHHACFDMRSAAPSCPPALNPLPRFRVERRGDSVLVGEELPASSPARVEAGPESVVIAGGGGAGNAAAEMLRREGYAGPVTIVSADDAGPVDRPNLSKDYLAGTASADWIPLRGPEFYAEQRITLQLGRRVTALDTARRRLTMDDGSTLGYGALLLATGAEPIRLSIPVADGARLFYLRTLADSNAIIAAAGAAKCAVVLGASFIGLEAAASLRTRGLEVHVVAPDALPLERILGPELGEFVRSLHEEKGVVFHPGQTATRIDRGSVTLASGERLAADLVVAGIGVRPSDALAAAAGLRVENGIVVDRYLEASAPGVFAAGDVARYPDARSGENIRIEHWVVAERQGQTAARNILGRRETYASVPFFWSQHYDVQIAYVGHAHRWDAVVIDGSLSGRDFAARYVAGGRTLAVATVGRDRVSLRAELAMQRGDDAALRALSSN